MAWMVFALAYTGLVLMVVVMLADKMEVGWSQTTRQKGWESEDTYTGIPSPPIIWSLDRIVGDAVYVNVPLPWSNGGSTTRMVWCHQIGLAFPGAASIVMTFRDGKTVTYGAIIELDCEEVFS